MMIWMTLRMYPYQIKQTDLGIKVMPQELTLDKVMILLPIGVAPSWIVFDRIA